MLDRHIYVDQNIDTEGHKIISTFQRHVNLVSISSSLPIKRFEFFSDEKVEHQV